MNTIIVNDYLYECSRGQYHHHNINNVGINHAHPRFGDSAGLITHTRGLITVITISLKLPTASVFSLTACSKLM